MDGWVECMDSPPSLVVMSNETYVKLSKENPKWFCVFNSFSRIVCIDYNLNLFTLLILLSI